MGEPVDGSELGGRPPVLIVEDEPSILAAVQEFLELEGYPTVGACNGAVALEVLDRLPQRPALVLLDMRMPVMDGWGFARALRERGIHLPLVVMTAAQDPGSWGGEIRAERVVAKPFDLDEVLDAVRSVYDAATPKQC